MPHKDKSARAKKLREYYQRTKEDRRPLYRAWNRTYMRRKRAANPMLQRTFKLRAMGLTLQQFDALRIAQGNRCKICATPFGDTQYDRPHVDHDHACCPKNQACEKCIRGLLCRLCNLGLGYFKDSPVLLVRAVAYLEGETT